MADGPIETGGDEGDRTPDLGIANAALSQLSYIPGKGYYRVNLGLGQLRGCTR